MRFVETKTAVQKKCLMLHRARHLFFRQQNAVINPIRAHLAELGVGHMTMTSATDAVDGSSTGTQVPRTWLLLR
jgi:transposase